MEPPEFYYFDTSSLLDLDAYGLTKRLSKVNAIIVPEVLDEILNHNLRRRLEQTVTDRGPQRRAAFIPGGSLDKGERFTIRAMICSRDRGRRIYVSKDSESLEFVDMLPGDISENYMDTSGFVMRLYERGHVTEDDIKRILASDSRPPNKTCRERLECLVQQNE